MSIDQMIYLIVTAFLGLIGFLLRNHMQRIDNIEKTMDSKLNEQQTRQIMNDKLEPLKEGLDEVKEKLDKLYDILLK